ncbi:MAG: anti-sigma factor [Planctomycetes bacterium]|nr:anti-sigma factor [Planctomycetota bacterium]
MTPSTPPGRARLEELLGTEATQGLSAAEARELDELLEAFPDQDPDAFELAAAAVHLALAGPPEEMPAALAEKLYVASVALTPTSAPVRSPSKPRESGGRPAWAMWGGWVVAASLAGVLAYVLWSKPKEGVVLPTPALPTLDQVRDDIKKNADWKPATFAAAKGNLSGNVVWSDVKQDGVLEVKGLPPNDPKKERYQLWIMDGTRGPDAKPISAGLFDIRPGSPTLVRVNASIPIGDAAAFAISKEPPNGGPQPTLDQILLVMPAKAG